MKLVRHSAALVANPAAVNYSNQHSSSISHHHFCCCCCWRGVITLMLLLCVTQSACIQSAITSIGASTSPVADSRVSLLQQHDAYATPASEHFVTSRTDSTNGKSCLLRLLGNAQLRRTCRIAGTSTYRRFKCNADNDNNVQIAIR